MDSRLAASDARFLPFGERSVDVSTDRAEYVSIYPTGGLAGPTIEFNIPASQVGFLSLSQSYIHSQISVAKDDTGAGVQSFIHATAPEEGFADAIWNDIKVYINGVDVSDSTPGMYPYSAFYKNALSKSQDWVAGGITRFAYVNENSAEGVQPTIGNMITETLAQATGWGAEHQGWCMGSDKSVGSSAQTASPGGLNVGAVSRLPIDSVSHAFRQNKISTGMTAAVGAWDLKKGEYLTTPRLGIFENPNYIPANVDIRIVLTKSKDAFCIADQVPSVADPVTANIPWSRPGANSVRLMLRRVYPSSAMQEKFSKAILERPLRYNLTRSRIERANIQQMSSVDLTNMLTGVRPDLVIVQFVATAAVEGNYSYNPFCSTNVTQFNSLTKETTVAPAVPANIYGLAGDVVSSIFVRWGGVQVPLRPVEASSVDDAGESYQMYLAAANGGVFGERTPMLSPAGFRGGGRQIFCFNLQPTGARPGTMAMNLSDRGSLEVHATLARSGVFTEDTTVIVCGLHSASVEIDAAREIRKEGM